MLKINFTKKLALIFLCSILFFNSMAMPFATALAAPSTWYSPGVVDWYKKVYDGGNPSEIFGERYTAAQVQWIIYSLIVFPLNAFFEGKTDGVVCLLELSTKSTFDPISCLLGFGDILAITLDRIIPEIKLNPGPLLNQNQNTSNISFLSVLFNSPERPLSGINYFKDSISKFGLVDEINAQGFGYGAVNGLQKYWQGFRDIAYALTVLVVIVFAFMIMFRVKLSPQLVISVQSALPKIMGALVLATFSYAIAGFVIDLSYVVGGLFASLMTTAGFSQAVTQNNVQLTAFQFAFNEIVPLQGTSNSGGFYIFFWMFGYTFLFLITAIVAFFSTLLGGLSIYGAIVGLVGILFTLWVAVLMFVYLIKVPWVLLKNLISLFISIVVAPVQIVFGVLVPTIGFSMWFRKITAEALVFPLTGLFMFLASRTLAAAWVASFGQGEPKQNLWAPPILGSSGDMAGIIWLAVSFMFITLIPKAVDIMKMAIMGTKFEYGTAIGEAMAPIQGPLKFASGAGQEAIGRYAGYPIVKGIRDTEWYDKFRTSGSVGSGTDKVLSGLQAILEGRARKG